MIETKHLLTQLKIKKDIIDQLISLVEAVEKEHKLRGYRDANPDLDLQLSVVSEILANNRLIFTEQNVN